MQTFEQLELFTPGFSEPVNQIDIFELLAESVAEAAPQTIPSAQAIAELTAATVLEQFGGASHLQAMIAARNFSYDADGALSFHFSGSRKANMVRIALNAMDLYDVTFTKANRKLEVKEVGTLENIYADQLKGTVERFTGLYLSL